MIHGERGLSEKKGAGKSQLSLRKWGDGYRDKVNKRPLSKNLVRPKGKVELLCRHQGFGRPWGFWVGPLGAMGWGGL